MPWWFAGKCLDCGLLFLIAHQDDAHTPRKSPWDKRFEGFTLEREKGDAMAGAMSRSNKRQKRARKAMKKLGRRSRSGNLTLVEGGEPCPKCALPMQRCAHGEKWQPKVGQPYYFRFWDRCLRCKHIQLYEVAKVYLEGPPQNAETGLGADFDMDHWEMV